MGLASGADVVKYFFVMYHNLVTMVLGIVLCILCGSSLHLTMDPGHLHFPVRYLNTSAPGITPSDVANTHRGEWRDGTYFAPYLPAHLHNTTLALGLALGAVMIPTGIVGGYMFHQSMWRLHKNSSKPTHYGWLALMLCGALTFLMSLAVFIATSKLGNQEHSIHLNDRTLAEWETGFANVTWGIEGWACNVVADLNMDTSVKQGPGNDFSGLCSSSQLGKWTAFAFIFEGAFLFFLGLCLLRAHKHGVRRGRILRALTPNVEWQGHRCPSNRIESDPTWTPRSSTPSTLTPEVTRENHTIFEKGMVR